MDDRIDRAAQLLNCTEDELFQQIGASLYGRPALPPSPRRLVEMGKRWFDSKHGDIVKLVCSNERVRALSRQDVPTHELVVAVSGTLDLGSHYLGGAPVVTVAVLIVRLGVHQFCARSWDSSDDLDTHNTSNSDD
jgi:hypothetical protein